MDDDKKRCLWHEHNNRLMREKGFITGGCMIRWDVPCGGTPDSVPGHHQCPGQYVPIGDIERANRGKKL